MQRKFSAYEINHLNRFGIDPYSLDIEEIKEKPVEYITGFSEFYGRVFKVNEHTLIPRIETERIIDIALNSLPPFSKGGKEGGLSFVDIGTGSGAIGITLAKELEKRNIMYSGTLKDISAEALKVTSENINNHNLNLDLLKSDLFESLELKANSLQLILANLPYIPSSRINKLQDSVKDYEPLSALDGGEDGLDLIRKFFEELPRFIDKQGVAILEVDDTHDLKKAEEFSNNLEIKILKDLNEKNRFWVVRKK